MDGHSDSPWNCVSCQASIDYDAGAVSLDSSAELHVCEGCWETLSPVERIEAVRKWRGDRRHAAALEKFEALADGALSGWHIPGFLSGPERN